MKPVLFVTGHAPPDRVLPFALLHEREEVEFALFGGRSIHGAAPAGHTSEEQPVGQPYRAAEGLDAAGPFPFPHRFVGQREVFGLAASGRYRAVVISTGGRVALPAGWAGARAGRRPLLLWSALWAQPRSPLHAASGLALARLYRSADAVVTYGPHVSEYVRRRGARNVHVAPQAVDNAFWGAAASAPASDAWGLADGVRFLFVGRAAREKGLRALLSAWRASGLTAPTAALVLVGVGPSPPWAPTGGAAAPDGPSVRSVAPVGPAELRNFYAAADVLVMPSIPTATFREPWGLVANEAMNQRVPVIASDAVGAAAGGLIRHERNGLVVPAGDVDALAAAMGRLAADGELRRSLGAAAGLDVAAYTPQAWAEGFSAALASVGVSREGRC